MSLRKVIGMLGNWKNGQSLGRLLKRLARRIGGKGERKSESEKISFDEFRVIELPRDKVEQGQSSYIGATIRVVLWPVISFSLLMGFVLWRRDVQKKELEQIRIDLMHAELVERIVQNEKDISSFYEVVEEDDIPVVMENVSISDEGNIIPDALFEVDVDGLVESQEGGVQYEVVEVYGEIREIDGFDILIDYKKCDVEFCTDTVLLVRYSYYWPPLGGVNCSDPCEYMYNGARWDKWVGYAVACPVEFPIGTRLRISGRIYECMDRGGAIVKLDDGTYWIDFLEPVQRYPFWTILGAEIDYPAYKGGE